MDQLMVWSCRGFVGADTPGAPCTATADNLVADTKGKGKRKGKGKKEKKRNLPAPNLLPAVLLQVRTKHTVTRPAARISRARVASSCTYGHTAAVPLRRYSKRRLRARPSDSANPAGSRVVTALQTEPTARRRNPDTGPSLATQTSAPAPAPGRKTRHRTGRAILTAHRAGSAAGSRRRQQLQVGGPEPERQRAQGQQQP